MKILIGYDGSECADAALRDLRRAGLPTKADALVLAVADVLLPPPLKDHEVAFPTYVPPGVKRAHERAAHELDHARKLGERARTQLERLFPEWELHVEACADSPAWALVSRAENWNPDLIVVGSHGHAALGGRLILGSVSQRVLYEAHTSVRIARGRVVASNQPVRIVIGMDGSTDSYAALDAVAARTWPEATEVGLITVLDTVIYVVPDPAQPDIGKWFECDKQGDRDRLNDIFESAANKLRKSGLDTTVTIVKGQPNLKLIEEAESWYADSIFVGAHGTRGVSRLLLGSVSASVAARAHCSVEVIRG